MPRFVILEHAPGVASRDDRKHWDLMLEADGRLWTWALPEAPILGVSQPCERLADHRLVYLDYQGDVSGDRGTVTRWDQGDYELLRSEADSLEPRLHGARLRAIARLTRQQGKPQRWLLELLPF